MIEISRFTPAASQGVFEVILPIQQQEFGVPVTAADQPDLGDIPAFYQTGNGDFWLASHQGRIVGTLGLKDIGEGQAALRKMFVNADYRGGEYRVAAQLLERLLEHARYYAIRDIFLGTTDKFHAAHRFYRKHGFEPVDVASLPAAFPLMAVDSLFFRLRLRP